MNADTILLIEYMHTCKSCKEKWFTYYKKMSLFHLHNKYWNPTMYFWYYKTKVMLFYQKLMAKTGQWYVLKEKAAVSIVVLKVMAIIGLYNKLV